MDFEIKIDLYLIATIASLSIGMFFIFYFVGTKRMGRRTERILLYILTLFILFILYNYLVHSRLIYHVPWFFMFGRHLDVLIYLLLFLYFRSFGNRGEVPLAKVHWALLGGLLFLLLIKSPGYLLMSSLEQQQLLDLFYSDTRPGPVSIWRSPTFFLLKFALPVALLSLSGIQLFRAVLPKLQHKAIRDLLLFSYISLVLFVIFQNWIFKQLYLIFACSFIEWPIELLVMSFILIVLMFYALKLKDSNINSSKYEGSSLSKDSMLHYVERLRTFMEQDRAYMDPELTLTIVAQKLHINTAYLSQAINAQLNLRFNDFLNTYRIEEAKKLLANPEYDKYTIDTLAKKVGFKSLSPFYRAFRKHTGVSPNTFKRNLSH